ncbi:DUF58 domain-containing protein [Nakamurella antarctica]|uniref:DUF58 domain-containing protein n=1 Tax=Nakamurella antarctica TaxID=1902245 RepID=UPI0013DDB3E0|nr:DUF58 domain-containing protein [Nakamurella antarctica]
MPKSDAGGAVSSFGRSHRGLTTRGRCLLAGGLAACVCAVILDERDLLRIGLVATLLPLVAWVVSASRRTQLSATHQVAPARLSPGLTGRVDLIITNTGSSQTRPIELQEAATPDLSPGAHCLIPALGRGRSAVTSYPVHAKRRGRFVIGPPHVHIADPFGTWEDSRSLPATTEVLVVPSVIPLTGTPSSGGSKSAASGRAAQGTVGGSPDIGIRQYQRGDDIRSVHWRASARHDDLMVRLTEPVSHGGASVLLDHRASAHHGTGEDSSFETAVSLAASVALHLLAGDHQVRLVSHTGKVLADGHDITDDVLASLALLETDPQRTIAASATTDTGLLVAVLGQTDRDTTKLLIAARRRASNAIALVIAAGEWDRHSATAARDFETTIEMVGLLRAAGWRVVEVHPQDSLAAIWQRACSAGDFNGGLSGGLSGGFSAGFSGGGFADGAVPTGEPVDAPDAARALR